MSNMEVIIAGEQEPTEESPREAVCGEAKKQDQRRGSTLSYW